MTKKLTTPQNTIPKPQERKLFCDHYKDLFTFKTIPISQEFIERLAQDLIAWATTDDDALRLTQFITKIGIHPRTFDGWSKKHPTLKFAKEAALLIIGDRREIGALKNKYNANVVMKQQHRYNEEWWDSEVKRAELKARTQQDFQGTAKYTIVLDNYADNKPIPKPEESND